MNALRRQSPVPEPRNLPQDSDTGRPALGELE
jgi:hypothetical protein